MNFTDDSIENFVRRLEFIGKFARVESVAHAITNIHGDREMERERKREKREKLIEILLQITPHDASHAYSRL